MSEVLQLVDQGPSLVDAAALDADLPLDRHGPGHDPVASMRRTVRARSRTYLAALPRTSDGLLDHDRSEVLHRAGEARAAVTAAQVVELEAAVAWAALHPVATHGTDVPGGERETAVAGEGAPEVAEFCIPELALRLGVSTDSGRSLLGDAVELAHRLPRCWEALRAGGVAVFRARRVAQATRTLTPEAAAEVDAEVAPYLHGLGVKALEGIVAAAIWHHDLPRALEESAHALDRRGIIIDLDQPRGEGAASTVAIHGDLDAADALELERAIQHLAEQLRLAGSAESLDVRRSQALGMLARHETVPVVPDLVSDPGLEEWDPEPVADPAPERRRHVVLHVHLADAALRGTAGLARVEGLAGPVTTEQVRAWCAAPGTSTTLTVRPVVDLDATVTAGSYEIPTDVAEAVVTRDRTCVFPHCAVGARRCDLDHVIPHDPDGPGGGPTSTANIAPLCRRHHRAKTHHPGWTYRVLHPGTYLWTTPGGQRLLRDPGGTHLL